LPSQSFFWFCEDLLNRYCQDERIFIISGYNKQQQWKPEKYDYFFSNFGGIWGWASWRRAWQHYDADMSNLEYLASTGYFEKLLGRKLGRIRKKQLLNAKMQINIGKMDTWAYPWAFSRHLHKGIACVSSVSLISNIGFGDDATHTFASCSDKIYRNEINIPTCLNRDVKPDPVYDVHFLNQANIFYRILKRIRKLINS